MMDPIRTFIAVELPDIIKQQVEALELQLMKARADIKWVKATDLHLTLKFLGDIPRMRLQEVGAGMREAIDGLSSFRLALGTLGAFPNLDRPRVFWVGVEDGSEALIALQRRVETELCVREFVREERPFSPHLTIGRVRSPKGLSGLIDQVKNLRMQWPEFKVDRVAVIRSELRPAGPIYTVLEQVELSKDSGR